VLEEGECALGTVPDDVDAQEPLGRTQVTKLEVLTQLLLHSLYGLCIRKFVFIKKFESAYKHK
jgi:hypothetical protein